MDKVSNYEMPDLPSSCSHQLVSFGLSHDRERRREYKGESQYYPYRNGAGEDHPCDGEAVKQPYRDDKESKNCHSDDHSPAQCDTFPRIVVDL